MRAFALSLILTLALPLAACAQEVAHATYMTYSHPRLTPAAGPLVITNFKPPADYARWYANMERCLGLEGDYDAVRWFVVPAPWRGSEQVTGLTHGANIGENRIIVNATEWRDSVLVEHESVHHILAQHDLQGEMNHPMPYYDGRCASEWYTPPAER